METYTIKSYLTAFGMQVKTFPTGIAETFEKLAKTLQDSFNRAYYGISYFNKEVEIIYNAAAEEKWEGEAGKYNFDQFVIEKGEYLTVPVKDWRKKTASIKDVFHEMMKDSRVSKSSPCIEWYKNDAEMLCMIKIQPLKE